MKSLRTLIVIMLVMGLSACVHNRHRTAEAKAFVNAQTKAAEHQKPLVELIAQEGQTIELRGVSAFRVYAPKDSAIRALPQQESAWLKFGTRLLDRGAQVVGIKFASDTLSSIFDSAVSNAGDHSTTTISIADSYNDQSDHSVHGDTIVDSQVIDGDAIGPGAGIGNDSSTDLSVTGDGSAIGDGNEVVNGDNADNSGVIGEGNRQDSDDVIDTRTCAAGAGGAATGTETDAGDGGACAQGD